MPEFGEIAEALRRSTVQVFPAPAPAGQGSGILWTRDGLIVTNAHVARSAVAEVLLWDGRRLPARRLLCDPWRDLAILRVLAPDLPAAAIGDSAAVRPGELAIAVGSPFGLPGAVSTGAIHSIGPIRGLGEQRWIRAGLQLAPGNSGGPLANARGQVIGINSAIVGGLAVAAPASSAAQLIRAARHLAAPAEAA